MKKPKFKIKITGNIINANYTTHKKPSVKYLKTIAKLGTHKVEIKQL